MQWDFVASSRGHQLHQLVGFCANRGVVTFAMLSFLILVGGLVIGGWCASPTKMEVRPVAGPPIAPNPGGPSIRTAPPGPICEWKPRQTILPTAQCGFNSIGAAKSGVFDCGKVSNGTTCIDSCQFKRCQ
jgi:hypothetical protein